MEVKDTVIKYKRKHPVIAGSNEWHMIDGYNIGAEAQAEITWDIAYKAGKEETLSAAVGQLKAEAQYLANRVREAETLKHRLDRPELREEIAIQLYSMNHRRLFWSEDIKAHWDRETQETKEHYLWQADQLLPLIPDEEEVRKEGRREVVEFLKSFTWHDLDDYVDVIYVSKIDWQAKLKEWEVKE